MTLIFAWRYFKAKKSTNAINIISWISVLAIAVGSAALIIVLSVFNGFEDLVKGLYADFYADVRIAPASNAKFLTLTPAQLQVIKGVNGVTAVSMIAEEKAVLVNEGLQSIIFLKGVDANYTGVSGLAQHLISGKFILGETEDPSLVLGAGVENAVGVSAGTNFLPLTVYLPNRKANSFLLTEALNSYNASVTGSFALQQEFDNKYAITNIGFVKYMLDLGENEFSSAEIKLADLNTTNKAVVELKRLLGAKYLVQTRYQQNQSLYSVMQIEKWVIYGILSLILVVAAFNMIGALTMLVLEKQKDIAVLKALGANDAYIQRIFLCEGFVIAAIGGGSGIVLAIIVCLIQIKLKLVKLGGGSFIIDYYPVKMLPADFILVITTITCIALLAAWIPSRKASMQEFTLKS